MYWAPAEKEQVGFKAPFRTAYLPKEEPCRIAALVASGSPLDCFEGSTDACSESMMRYFV